MAESVAAGAQDELLNVLRLIREIPVALLTTFDKGGGFHTRPVQTLAVENDGTLWFFTDVHSGKAHELSTDTRVALGYADTVAGRYVAVSGWGTIRRDPDKAQQLWRFEQHAYYPEGPTDERLGVLRVKIERAEYWIAPGRPSYLFEALKATVTGVPAGVVGRNEHAR